MADYLNFEARIVPLQWGRATYTILPVPDEIVAALEAQGAKRVEGEIGDYPINLALSRADKDVFDGVFLWTGKSFLNDAGLTPGDVLEVRLRPADPDHVEMPDGLAAALAAAGLTAAWQALSPGKRRGLVHTVATAKRPETKLKRIAALVEDLKATAPD